MTYELHEDGSLTPLPKNNIDTGMGLERMAAILQGAGSVFETDGFRPLIDLAEQLSGRSYGDDRVTTRAMRIIADHSRGMTFLIADGVVPSNEERGYVLRRVMRRAIQQGRALELESPWLRQVRGADDRADGRRVSRAGGAAGDDHAVGRGRGDGVRAHARPRHGPAGAARRRGRGAGHVLDRRRRRLQAPRHLRLSLRPDQGAARRAGAVGGRLGLRGPDGEAAGPGANRRRARDPRPPPGRDLVRLRRRRRPPSSATRRSTPRPP